MGPMRTRTLVDVELLHHRDHVLDGILDVATVARLTVQVPRRKDHQSARKLIPTSRHAARFDLTRMVVGSDFRTTAEAVDYLMWRFLRVPTAPPTRDAFVSFLTSELGTDNIERASSYMEDALRMTVHLIMSTPEYQIV